MERKQIAPAAYLCRIGAEKFNQCRVALHFQYPARRDRATADALLPLVLERGFADCPDMTEMSRRLARLYGADLTVETAMNGANRVLTVSVTGLKDELALEGEALSRQYAALALGVAFHPYLVGDTFDPEAVEIEKDKLKKQLEAQVNNKRSYCVRQARRRYFGSSPAGIERDGYPEEVEGITPAALTQAYREMLRTATIDLMAVGADGDMLAELLAGELAGLDRQPLALAPASAMPRQEPALFEENMEMEQAKLCLLFTAGRPTGTEEMAACRLAMSLFGGSATSRLFLNVREKQSLCYYCGATYSSVTGTMSVDSGIQPQNAARAEAAILKELKDLCEGPITQEELEDCRRGLLSGLGSVEDTLSGLENWYYTEICRDGAVDSPAQARAALEAVTADQVRQVLRMFSLSVRYLLTPKEAQEDA